MICIPNKEVSKELLEALWNQDDTKTKEYCAKIKLLSNIV